MAAAIPVSIVFNASSQKLLAAIAAARSSLGSFLDLTKRGGASGADAMKGITTSAQGAAGAVRGVTAAFVAVGAAVAGIGLAAQKAFSLNSQREDAQLATRVILTGLYEIRDAQGQLLQGDAKRAAAAELALVQEQKLAQMAVKSSLSLAELRENMRLGLSVGATSGLDVDQIREVTFALSQAGKTLGLASDQFRSEINAIFSGDINVDAELARTLQISREDVTKWKASGAETFYNELISRAKTFADAGEEAAQTWTGALSNIGDTVDKFLTDASASAFQNIRKALLQSVDGVLDDNGEVSQQFEGLASAAEAAFNGVGTVVVDIIEGLVELAQDLSAFISENSDGFSTMAATASVIYESIKGIFSSLGDILGMVFSVNSGMDGFTSKAEAVAIAVGFIEDGFKLLGIGIRFLGGLVLDAFGGPLKTVLNGLREFVSLIPGVGKSLASAIDSFVRRIPDDGFGLKADAAAALEDLKKAGPPAERIRKAIAEAKLDRETKAALAGTTATGGKTTATAAPPKPAAAAGAGKARQAVEREARALEKATQRYREAELAAERAVADSQREIAESKLEARLAAGLVSQRQYFDERYLLEKGALDREIRLLEDKKAELDALAGDKAKPESQRVQASAEAKKLEGDLAGLNAKGFQLKTKLDIDEIDLKKRLEDLDAEVRISLLTLDGKTLEAGLEELKQATAKALANPDIRFDTERQARIRLESEKKANALIFEDYQAKSSDALAKLQVEEQFLQLARAAGNLDIVQFEEQLTAARRENLAVLLKQVEAAEALARASGNPQQVAVARQLRLEYEQTAAAATDLADDLTRTFSEEVAQGIREAAQGTREWGDVLLGAVLSVLNKIADSYAEDFSNSLTKALKDSGFSDLLRKGLSGLGGGLGDLVSTIGGFFGGFFANGGRIYGQGTPTSDSVPIMASRDEFMVRAWAAKKLGYDALRYINATGQLPQALATGGIVGRAPAQQSVSVSAPSVTNQVSQILVHDAEEAARVQGSTREFRNAVLTIIRSNKRSLGIS